MKLEKLKMPMPGKGKKPFPPKAAKEQDPEMEAEEEELGIDLEGDEEAGEPEEHKALVLGRDLGPADEEEVGPNPELEAVSDDELMAELKKRGLMSKLTGEGEEEAEADSEEYMA